MLSFAIGCKRIDTCESLGINLVEFVDLQASLYRGIAVGLLATNGNIRVFGSMSDMNGDVGRESLARFDDDRAVRESKKLLFAKTATDCKVCTYPITECHLTDALGNASGTYRPSRDDTPLGNSVGNEVEVTLQLVDIGRIIGAMAVPYAI